MARQDILMDASLGEIATSEGLAGKLFYAFRLLPDADDQVIRGEIVVPADFTVRYRDASGMRVEIPYTPVYKELSVRLRLDNGTGHEEYVVNPANNRIWYPVYRKDDAGASRIVRLSEYDTISEVGIFNLILHDGYLALFAGAETDLEIGAAKYQNEVFLLKALPGSLYQYPTTGVGLIDFLHGNFENNGLAAKLQAEFESDNVIIVNAYMDSTSGKLLLETKEKEDLNG